MAPVAPEAVRWIARKLEDAGYETWAVGGAIRDAVRGRPSGDWDLATRATPGQMRKVFRRTVPIGVEHGTIGVLARDEVMYEVTTFRRDVETDGRHAVVEFADTIEDDLSRRDFTINAIAWHPLREELLDPFDGAGDLKRKVLRTVGEASDRFREDYLRILRALRFAGRFDLTVDPETWAAMTALVDHLTGLSPERIREELVKVLDADRRPSRAMDLYARSGALRTLYPEVAAVADGRLASTFATLDFLPRGRALLRLAALLRPVSPPDAAAILLRLRLSNAAVDETARLASAPSLPGADVTDADRRRWLSAVGSQRLHALTRLDLAAARAVEGASSDRAPAEVVAAWRGIREVRRAAPPLTLKDLELDGRGLIRLGLKPGPHFGDILQALLDWVLEDPGRNQRAALEARANELVESGAP